MADKRGPGQATDPYTTSMAIASYEAARNMPDIVRALCRERDVLKAAVEKMLIGGNHLATHIDPEGPDWHEDHSLALDFYEAGPAYDAWCCWRAIMQAREMLKDV